MNQYQTYDKCEYYDSDKCPHIDNEVMKNLSAGIVVNVEEGNNPFSTTKEVNKLLCSTCNSFKNKFSGE